MHARKRNLFTCFNGGGKASRRKGSMDMADVLDGGIMQISFNLMKSVL